MYSISSVVIGETETPFPAKYLISVKHAALREGIARALTLPVARGGPGRVMLDELKTNQDPYHSEARWALAQALTVVADKSLHDESRLLA